MSKLYFAKFNINENIHEIYDGKKDLDFYLKKIVVGLNEKTVICYSETKRKVIDVFSIDDIKNSDDPESVREPEESCSYYKFMTLNSVQKNGDEIFNGRVIRIYADDWHRFRIDADGKESLTDYHTSDKTSYCTFSFNITKEIIGFSTKSDFRKEKFVRIFTHLIEETVPALGEIEINLLIDGRALDVKFDRINRLYDLSIDFIPPNESKKDVLEILKKLNNGVKETNATKSKLVLHAPPKEPINKAAKVVEAIISMAKLGYGRVKASGIARNQENVEIDTEKDVAYYREVPQNSRDVIETLNSETEEAILYYQILKQNEVRKDE